VHVFDHAVGKFAGLYFGCALHQALEVVGNFLLFDSAFEALFDQIRGFGPSRKRNIMTPKESRSRVDDVFVGVFGSGAVSGFEDGVAVADVGSRGDAETANLGGAGVGDIVSVQIGVARTLYSSARVTTCWKMESAMRSLIISFFFHAPCRGWRRWNRGLAALLFPRPDEFRWREFHSGLDQFSILRDCEARILVFVVDDPALALGNDLFAESSVAISYPHLRNAPR